MNDGGPAFPRPAFSDDVQIIRSAPQDGMSMRDYFADSAMHAIMNNPTRYANNLGQSFQEFIAQQAYIQADAMLAERKKGA